MRRDRTNLGRVSLVRKLTSPSAAPVVRKSPNADIIKRADIYEFGAPSSFREFVGILGRVHYSPLLAIGPNIMFSTAWSY